MSEDTERDVEWHRVASFGELDEDEPEHARVGDYLIGIYKLGDRVYAIDDVCTHEFAVLSEGFVEGEEIECPLHQARFHIPTGKVTALPAEEDVRTYPVKVDGDDVYVGVPKD